MMSGFGGPISRGVEESFPTALTRVAVGANALEWKGASANRRMVGRCMVDSAEEEGLETTTQKKNGSELVLLW